MKQIKTKTLDRLWSQAVKKIRGNKCEYCGTGPSETQIDTHHIYGRRNYSTRWCVGNGVVLCAAHHTFSNFFSAHQTPIEFADFIFSKRPNYLLDNLRDEARKICRASEIDREQIRDSLKEIINA